jgi:hypothetical protein
MPCAPCLVYDHSMLAFHEHSMLAFPCLVHEHSMLAFPAAPCHACIQCSTPRAHNNTLPGSLEVSHTRDKFTLNPKP